MIATAKPWTTKNGCSGAYDRTYFAHARRAVTAHVTTDPQEGRVWWLVTALDGRDRFGKDIVRTVARGSYALTPHALRTAKTRASRIAHPVARAEATAYFKARMARAMERVTAARAALDATDLGDYRTLVHRQDEMAQLTAELEEVKRHMLALAS